jgi:GT2 family glycosyltransferase
MKSRAGMLAPCGIRHIQLAGPFASIEAAPGERAIYAVFWRRNRPVGVRLLMAGELPVPAAAIPSLAADASAEAILAAEDDSTVSREVASGEPSVSVVVCSRDRSADLRRCLESLVRCRPLPCEIIVVDNASADESTRRVVEGFPGVRYVLEPRPGLSHARNAGVNQARGSIVAFTDDDVEVTEGWIAAVAAPFAEASTACITGIVLPADLASEAACLFEFAVGGFGNALLPRQYGAAFVNQSGWRAPAVWQIGAGANMAIRRSAFATVGLFDPRLGAGASGCSEDSEFWFRLLRAGYVCRYQPAAVVFHYHRAERQALLKQLRAYSRGHVTALFAQLKQDRQSSHLIRALLVMPVYYARMMALGILSGNRNHLALVGWQALGWLEGILFLARWLRQPGPSQLVEQEAYGSTSS